MNVFIDTNSLYRNSKRKFHCKLNYGTLINQQDKHWVYVRKQQGDVQKFVDYFKANCDCKVRVEVAVKHRSVCTRCECESHFHTCSHVAQMTIDVLTNLGPVDEPIMIMSNDWELLPLVKFLSGRGHVVIVKAINVPEAFKPFATVRELTVEDCYE